jgi:hypothetical protein
MPIGSRVTACCAVCSAIFAATLPGAALAHGGSAWGYHGHGLRDTGFAGLCGRAGAPLSVHRADASDHGPSGLSEEQIAELRAACEKLVGPYDSLRGAQEAASKAFWETVEAARAKLDEACPALRDAQGSWSWESSELGPECQEALRSYVAAVRAAQENYRIAVEPAFKAFETAFAEFEAAVKPILEQLGNVDHHHGRHFGYWQEPGYRGSQGADVPRGHGH